MKRQPSVVAVLGLLFSASVLAQHPSDALFDPSELRTIRLTMEPEHWVSLVENVWSTDVYPCTFEWSDQRLEFVGVRIKGQSSRQVATKPSLRFRFNHFVDQKLFQLTRLDAQAMKDDVSMLRERLIYNIARRRGAAAPRSMHMRLEVNGNYVGLYTIVDQFDQAEMLRMHFANEKGNLYKANTQSEQHDATIWRGFDPAAYIDVAYDWERQATTQPDDLLRTLYIANHATDAELLAVLPTLLDIDSLLEYCAINQVIAAEDWMFTDVLNWGPPLQRGGPWGHNFYWYFVPTDGRAKTILWDVDASMSYVWTPEGWVNRAITLGFDQSVLGRRLMGIDAWRESFLKKVLEILDRAFDPATVVADLDRIYAQIRSAAEQDPWKPHTNEQFHSEVASLRRDIPLRVANVRAQAGCPGDTFTRLGKGCPGTAGLIPDHTGSGIAVVGRTFSWHLRDACPDTAAVLLLGTSSVNIDLTAIGLPGCTLLVQPQGERELWLSQRGTLELPTSLPNDPELLGALLVSQFIVIDPGAGNPLSVVTSNGLETRVGQCR